MLQHETHTRNKLDTGTTHQTHHTNEPYACINRDLMLSPSGQVRELMHKCETPTRMRMVVPATTHGSKTHV